MRTITNGAVVIARRKAANARFGKLYGVNNWVTLGRWIKEEGAPAGFYLGKNTRAWYKEDWDAWLAARPKADPPPEKVKGPGAVPPAPEARKPKPPFSPTKISESAPASTLFRMGGLAHEHDLIDGGSIKPAG